MPAILETATYRDAKGNLGRVRFYVAQTGTQITQATAANTIITDMNALTNAFLQAAHGPINQAPLDVNYGGLAQFQNAADKMMMVFQSSAGTWHRYQIPAPKATNFLTDLETVDPSVLAVSTYIADMIANTTDQFGNALTKYIGGIRLRRKISKRLNITILGPGDTQEIPAE